MILSHQVLITIVTSILLATAAAASSLVNLNNGIAAAEEAQAIVVNKTDDKFPQLVEWFQTQGGTIDERIIIGYEPQTNIRGTIATSNIPANTVIMHIPKSLILVGVEENEWCANYEAIKYEMNLGTKSKWYEYFNFDGSTTGSRLPLQWDRDNNATDHGYPLFEIQRTIPQGIAHQHIDWFQGEGGCIVGKEMTDVDFQAFKIYLTRPMDLGLVPMYDLMNHHNGLINTYLLVDEEEGGVSVVTLLDIPAGMPIYNTYGRSGQQATNDLFTTYGFIEDYPQLWKLYTNTAIDNNESIDTADNMMYDHTNLGCIADNDIMENHPHVGTWVGMLNYEPNYTHDDDDDGANVVYEVLVISPTLAALVPSKHLTGILRNGQLTYKQWEIEIAAHHTSLAPTYITFLLDTLKRTLANMPTTIAKDVEIIVFEKRRLGLGYGTMNDSDTLMAIEYRLAYKKALRLAMEIAKQQLLLGGVGGDEF